MGDDRSILLLGASGYIGRHLRARLGVARTIATYHRTPVAGGVYFDCRSMRLADIVAEPGKVSHAVLLLGNANPESCAMDPAVSTHLNVTCVRRLIDDLRQWGVTVVFASSDAVFDGTAGGYDETHQPNPVLTYGRQKAAIETELQLASGSLILRLPRVFGVVADDGTILTNWIRDIAEDRTIDCAHDQVFSPIFVGDAVEAIARLIDRNETGLFHVAGPDTFSRLTLLHRLMTHVPADLASRVRIRPCSIHDLPLLERRPLNLSMNPARLIAATGLRFTDIDALCARAAGLLEGQVRPDYAGTVPQ
jgi:dTDP-4-dehydrorhamnose reductase